MVQQIATGDIESFQLVSFCSYMQERIEINHCRHGYTHSGRT